ncbi:MAG: NAD-dependent epimerase/dehydratase family protein [Candidatus Pacearchaeota archaeon]
MERVLVTGGVGYVGSVLVPMLLNQGYKVSVLDNLIHENSLNTFLTRVGDHTILTHPNFMGFIKGDIRDQKTVLEAAKEVDSLIHLAAIVGAPYCDKNPELAVSTNIKGTDNIIKSISPKQKIVYASTGSVYGKIDDMCLETSNTNPLSLYGKTKLEAEKMILDFGGVAFRFATAFGLSPRLRLDLLPNDFTYKLVKGRHLDIYEANAKRTFIHVSDMARSFIFALKNYDYMKGEAFNVGDEELNLTKIELAEKIKCKIKEFFGFDVYIWKEEGKKDPDQRDYAVAYQKIKKIGGEGFRTKVSLDAGLEELVKFMSIFEIKDQFRNA